MSEIASTLPEGSSTNGSASKSWSAGLCLAACLGLFVVVATLMSGFDAVLFRAVQACMADWRIPAAIVLGAALIGVVGFVIYWMPSLFEVGVLAALPVTVPFFWYQLWNATTDNGVHPVSAPLLLGMIVASLLFAACISLHFGRFWGASKAMRLYTGFLVGSAVTLAFTGVVTAIAFDKLELKARDAAQTAFAELHKGEEFGAVGRMEMSGYKFACLMSANNVSCRRVND